MLRCRSVVAGRKEAVNLVKDIGYFVLGAAALTDAQC
jgi:hypothetical protein